MPTEPTAHHDEVHELLALYALDSCDELETRTVERHVAYCGDCHAELRELRATSAELAFAPGAAGPGGMPRGLRDGILAAIDAEVRLDPQSERAPSRAPRRVARRRARFVPARGFAMPAMAACLVLAAAGFGVQTVRLRGDGPSTRPAPAATSSSKMLATSRVVSMETSGQLAAAKVELVDVHGTGMVVSKGLPTPPAGKQWRVWGVTPEHAMHPMAQLDADSTTGMSLAAIGRLRGEGLIAVAVSLEDADAGADQRGPVLGWAQI